MRRIENSLLSDIIIEKLDMEKSYRCNYEIRIKVWRTTKAAQLLEFGELLRLRNYFNLQKSILGQMTHYNETTRTFDIRSYTTMGII